MKDTKAWLKKIQEEESFAKKYKNLDNVKSIQEQAEKDGYEINNGDLDNVDLKKIAGGYLAKVDTKVNIGTQKATINVSAKGEGATAINNADINMNMNFGG